MRRGIKRVSGRERRIAVERIKKVAELLRQGDGEEVVEFVERGRYNFLNRAGCARIDPMHRSDLGVCLQCGNFDELNLVCKVERA